jgi:hypothetical protein
MSDMPRCATCQHWDREIAGEDPEDEWGECALLENPYDTRHNEVRVGNASLAFRLEGGWADCVFVGTREDFGCVLHEPRAEE